ncbi:amino acid ABC transporter permease [Variovorax paradoxus]|jgi:glutamate/aspartate transport system permease protein|uniref:amino acid ABC transporter permease n=1 Tax=Variovorax paradoxus TaxID=34073 RepID=UPI0029C61E88|nr:amino acid ABC transporter permease [Variovorax paradoxus]WPH22131.1 amino acid ABC transporter permease [Variovorax paradoxus]
MGYDFDWAALQRAWPYLMQGLQMTAFLVAAAMAAGIGLGTLLAITRIFAPRPVAALVAGYVNLFRSIPLILTILWIYFLMPVVLRSVTGDPNLSVGPIYAALVAFVLAESAYYCEIIRAGIASVRAGQMQAAQSLGMTPWQALRHVILPQAFRNMTPSLINQTIALLKDTSLVYVISLNDFLGAASKVGQRDGRVVEVYILVAVVYLVLCTAGAWWVTWLQRRKTTSAA